MNTTLDALANAQQNFVSWCLPAATNEVLIEANNAFYIFNQFVISLLTIAAGLALCVYVFNTLLAFKYKEATQHDWLSLLGALCATFFMVHVWDFLGALYRVVSVSDGTLLGVLLACLAFNALFVGYYLTQSLRGLYRHMLRHARRARDVIRARRSSGK